MGTCGIMVDASFCFFEGKKIQDVEGLIFALCLFWVLCLWTSGAVFYEILQVSLLLRKCPDFGIWLCRREKIRRFKNPVIIWTTFIWFFFSQYFISTITSNAFKLIWRSLLNLLRILKIWKLQLNWLFVMKIMFATDVPLHTVAGTEICTDPQSAPFDREMLWKLQNAFCLKISNSWRVGESLPESFLKFEQGTTKCTFLMFIVHKLRKFYLMFIKQASFHS